MFISLDLPEDRPLDWKTTLEDLERDYSALVNGLFDAQLKGRVRDMQHKAAHSKMGANIVRFPFKNLLCTIFIYFFNEVLFICPPASWDNPISYDRHCPYPRPS